MGKHTFSGHDTISRLLIDCTTLMALLAYLSYLKTNLTQGKTSADRQGEKIYSSGNDIFGKVTVFEGKTFPAHLIDTLLRKQADLPVPVPGVSIPDNTKAFFENG
jgi:hypothetical protein